MTILSPAFLDYLSAAFLVAGGIFACGAGLGILRFPDVLMRAHASTKAGTLGAGLVLIGVVIHFSEVGVVLRALVTITFLMLTAPIAAHIICRAAYHQGQPLWIKTVVDHLHTELSPNAADETDHPLFEADPDRSNEDRPD